jgi:hypothetical protein
VPRKRDEQITVATNRVAHVPCERCGAQRGSPCRSCMGNPTMPHTARMKAAEAEVSR